MSRTLIFMRHAKSAWNDPFASDHDRILNERGRRSAPVMGQWLKDQNLIPDQVLVSSAARTLETLARLGLPDVPTTVLPELYLAHPAVIAALIREHATGSRVLVLGHNPGTTEAAHRLVNTPVAHPAFHDFPTCATLAARFDGPSWEALDWQSLTPLAFAIPRELMA